MTCLVRVLGLVGLVVSAAAGGARSVAFDVQAALEGWTLQGDVRIDGAQPHAGAGALRIGPGAKALWKLRDTDGSGRVEMWVREDLTQVKDPKTRRVGPRWGLLQSDGRVVVLAIMHAPYLAGNRSYNTSDSDQRLWFSVQYMGIRRDAKWHRWTFDFGPDKGLVIRRDGKRTRFDWNRTKLLGFCGVALFGDGSKKEPHTLWVDDLSVELGGPVTARPTPPPPPPPVVPAKDPAVEQPVSLVATAKGRHPRLLFGADDVPAMKARARGEAKVFHDQLLAYLPSCVPPDHTKFQRDATDAMRQGFWRLPTVALHTVLTGERKSLEHAVGFVRKLLALKHWEEGREQDCGMGAANLMVGAALAYDWLYADLEPDLRTALRQRLLLQARRMFHGGHLMKRKGVHYWQPDPQNNHRHHRLAGLALAALAVAGEGLDDAWLLRKTADELAFVHRWLPPDGSYHDSPSYMGFGVIYMALAFHAADRCLGTRYLEHSFWRENPSFRLHTMAPGFRASFAYGDGGGTSFFNNYLLKATATHRLNDAQAGVLRLFEANRNAFMYGWSSLIWYDPSLQGGSLDRLPKAKLFADLGVAAMRDGWAADHTAVLFKCGPYGGHRLNAYRNQHDFHYINVAHDHPDANSFQLFARGHMLATDDGYPAKKLTSHHNTLLVDGKGQKGEGQGWTQPLRGKTDMSRLARIVAWKHAGDVAIVEGEAQGTYDRLTRFRRTLVWVRGGYLLVLDHVGAKAEAQLTWLLHSPAIEKTPDGYRVHKGPARCALRLFSHQPLAVSIERDLCENKGKPYARGQKLVVATTAAAWRLAALFDLWDHGTLTCEARGLGQGTATLVVAGPGFRDTWTWGRAPGPDTPSALKGQRPGGFAVELGAEAKIPDATTQP